MEHEHRTMGFLSKVVRILIPLLILAAGGGAAAYFKATSPKLKKMKPRASAPFVEIMEAERGPVKVSVRAMGTVAPALEVTLEPEVSGKVVEVNKDFTPGGFLPKGALALRLDRRDYEIEVRKKASAVANVKADLEIEYGQQEVAREEIKLLKKLSADALDNADLGLALRKPQLQQAQAELASAEAELAQAKLDLERTDVRVPFNALVTERSVNLGSQVNEQEALGTLVGTDEYWIEAALPVDRLAWLDLARKGGSPVEVRSQTSGQTWLGMANRVTGTLTDNTRMAKVLVTVKDPLGLKSGGASQPLILGDYVSLTFTGRGIEDVVMVPRQALRQGGVVWVAVNGTLDVRQVEVAWKDQDKAYVGTGLDQGDLVVVSDLAAPVQGMPLKTEAGQGEPENGGRKAGRAGGRERD